MSEEKKTKNIKKIIMRQKNLNIIINKIAFLIVILIMFQLRFNSESYLAVHY